ncbi:MAG: helix-turn-helix transcriptional regulator, partial [Bacteroidetes bacterium]|nr:helix-turn-helix transcriptional regulator [Bacteroidota bacterium]
MSIQKEFLKRIRKNLPEHISLVDELAELLNVSNDSAYRRLRGETSLTFDELVLLSQKFNVSVDSILGKSKNNKVSFQYNPIHETGLPFHQYFETLKTILYNYSILDNTQLIYAAKEAKFGLFHVPEIAAFKLFFWMKTSYDFEESKNKQFNFEEFNQNYGKAVSDIVKYYVRIPTIEIINEDYLNSTINQIRFYYDSGYFNTKAEAIMVCDKLKELICHNKREAELGFKFILGQPEVGDEGNLMLYHNEILHSDNVICGKVKEEYYCY